MKTTNFLAIALLTATTLVVSCKKKSDPTPDENPEAPVVTSTMTTSNLGSSGSAIASLNVTNSTGTAKIRLDVTSTVDLDKIYIMKSMDNESLVPVSVSTIVNGDGKTFSGGSSSFSLDVPNNTKSFVIDIPVSVRTSGSAVTDVYYVWLTNGSGDFLKPLKNTVLGPAIITLKYTSEAVVSFSTASANVGTQSASSYSFLVTSGQVSALSTADYEDSPGSADIRFVTLDAAGKKNNSASHVYMYSPADVEDANPATDASADFDAVAGSRTTYFAASSLTTSQFDAIDNGSSINFGDLSSTGSKKIEITSGNVYEFQTQAGKKGLIKINSLNASTGYNGNVTIKVLN